MSLESLANIGEFLGGIAVVLSLIYVGLQIRQNTKVTRAAAYRSFADSNNASLDAIIHSDEAVETWMKGIRDPSVLSEVESARFSMLMFRLLSAFETSFLLYKDGLLEEKHWHKQRGIARFWCEMPGIRSSLKNYQGAFDVDFLGEIVRPEAGA